mmetsp:Transcript_23168/g.38123  ORF Transcript_23168/g.38123 Transcript_23168/m.38123 type:complete len:297 (+) Transcript_23168:175-1065(+)|eukprot:CAMPEP_0184659210 /NCGR_PEP_ID=MMETSP0308-20130426/28821_1 /TAXON_ID=38269 /ORGANISM="Gloeochaete witrockiana, Strain SAG 46.84" /LENGTH=296 /DNA_ID=CAMNT_0027098875 /DNA_START=62 /DNA_END=952 /DNA_ORIENTATION=+
MDGVTPEARVLSIQSHVVRGYVGNKSAVFPLQVLGFEVDAINSVQFSNHTGYQSWTGQVLNGDQLWALIEGLEKNGLLKGYTHLLTGYVGSETFLRMILCVLQILRKYNPGLLYVCDPVMGDDGKLYVPKELVPLFRDEVVPQASLLVPNQFECELLTGISIRNELDAAEACDVLHRKGVVAVIITSLDIAGPESILLFASVPVSSSPVGLIKFKIKIPRLKTSFSGTGDLIAALLLAHSYRNPQDWIHSCELVVGTIQAVLRKTEESGGFELRLVQSKKHIESPEPLYKAEMFLS